MNDIIQLLPDNVANQIAAGEVIQRPASVIKELVENAVDAGAKKIDVLVVDAGRTSIQVVDDGKGMSDTDARLAFERHATSKISNADDLFALTTMGFRGEALASIAAVAQVELKTRMQDEELGTCLSISGGKMTGQESCACPVGSNFMVQNLFFNVPARRKFLKSNTTELNNIITAYERIALVYPQIAFTLYSNGTELLNLKACNVRQRIVDIFGKKISQHLLPIDVSTTLCSISGYVGKPEASKKKGAHQYFFVNGRYMKHPYFNKAVANAYERLVPIGEQVPYFIYFDVKPEDIDVNIHPTKTEIKFENEQPIWQVLTAAVKEAVGKFSDVPSIDFDTHGYPDIPVYNPHNTAQAPKLSFNPMYNPFKETGHSHPSSHIGQEMPSRMRQDVPAQWETLYDTGTQDSGTGTEADLFGMDMEQADSSSALIADKSPAHYQYKGKYIMTAVKSGLMIIDQHRAHVRILYERYLSQQVCHRRDSQKVLFPEAVSLMPSVAVVLEKILPEMEDLGFEITPLGGDSYAVNSVPAGLEGLNVQTLLMDMVNAVMDKNVDAVDEVNRSLALSLARNAAIPYGQVLGNEEMEVLVNDLFACNNVNYTPDGKSVLTIFGQKDIEKLLG